MPEVDSKVRDCLGETGFSVKDGNVELIAVLGTGDLTAMLPGWQLYKKEFRKKSRRDRVARFRIACDV